MNLEATSIKRISVHFVGNKSEDEELVLSRETLALDGFLNEKLTEFFLNKFVKLQEKYHFTHSSSLDYNEIYNFTKHIFYNKEDFHKVSQRVAQHLYDCSEHPMVKAGEVYVCEFERIQIEGVFYRGVGIFKTENKHGFFEVGDIDTNFEIEYKDGIDINKMDKACLILDTEEEEGFQVSIIDNLKGSGETALYWKDDFLGVVPTENAYYQTKELLTVTKEFIATKLDEEFVLSNTDKIDLLNKSVNYFKGAQEFVLEDFNDAVLQNDEIKASFGKFTNDEFTDSFPINEEAVKKSAKFFKSVIKLDKNFSIYVHGRKEMIEKGTDENGRRYYKLYYENEA